MTITSENRKIPHFLSYWDKLILRLTLQLILKFKIKIKKSEPITPAPEGGDHSSKKRAIVC